MNSRKRKGQLESMIGKIFVLSLFLFTCESDRSEQRKIRRRKQDAGDETESVGQLRSFPEITWNNGKSM